MLLARIIVYIRAVRWITGVIAENVVAHVVLVVIVNVPGSWFLRLVASIFGGGAYNIGVPAVFLFSFFYAVTL
jgi:hypothetical protein